MTDRPLLMIPGPIEVSPAVAAAFAVPPPSHVGPAVIAAFGAALERMRDVWRSAPDSRPVVIGGGGTLAMDMAVANLIEPGDRTLVVSTGYFSARMAEMLRRAGADVTVVGAEPGDAPTVEAVAAALAELRRGGPVKALFVTHVDTSTGVLVDPEPFARLAREAGALAVFDGVCATAGERFEMAEWDADLYLTGSQKALGVPPGLALMVASGRAVAARAARKAPPPMVLDWDLWLPIMAAYEARKPSYFSTPATNLILALAVALEEILTEGIDARMERHRRAAEALRGAWRALGLTPLPVRDELAAHTLSALYFPAGIGPSLVGRIREQGVIVAGGLLPGLKDRYFRVGHMGYAVTRPEMLERTVAAVAAALAAEGAPAPAELPGVADLAGAAAAS
jgi:alanine-glyoxylate transaminase / serine-glyoxylate transaminase / serine-pyruvate transaminase